MQERKREKKNSPKYYLQNNWFFLKIIDFLMHNCVFKYQMTKIKIQFCVSRSVKTSDKLLSLNYKFFHLEMYSRWYRVHSCWYRGKFDDLYRFSTECITFIIFKQKLENSKVSTPTNLQFLSITFFCEKVMLVTRVFTKLNKCLNCELFVPSVLFNAIFGRQVTKEQHKMKLNE